MFLIKNIRVYGEDAHSIEVFDGIYVYQNDRIYTTNGFTGINLQIDFDTDKKKLFANNNGRFFIDKVDDILGYQDKRLIKMSINGKSSESVEGALVFINAPLVKSKILSDGVNFLNKNVNEAVIFLSSVRDKIYISNSILSFEYGDLEIIR